MKKSQEIMLFLFLFHLTLDSFKRNQWQNQDRPLVVTLRQKCPYSELFWSVFSRIRTEYGEILRISSYSVRMRENTDQNNCKYGYFLRSANHWKIINIWKQ